MGPFPCFLPTVRFILDFVIFFNYLENKSFERLHTFCERAPNDAIDKTWAQNGPWAPSLVRSTVTFWQIGPKSGQIESQRLGYDFGPGIFCLADRQALEYSGSGSCHFKGKEFSLSDRAGLNHSHC